jgi:hypothetical protein
MAKKSSAVLNAKKIASKLKTTKKSKSVERYQSQGQNSPQSKAWTEAGDEGVKAKPIGYRWTTKGAEKVGKTPTSKPTPQDIEKYSGKTFKVRGVSHRYIYIERRVDKSDKSVRAKFKKGGVNQVGRQYPNYSEDMDGQRIAKPVGYRYTDRLAKRLGVDAYKRPTPAHIEKYLGKGVYVEKREDKTDNKPSKKYISLASGGGTQRIYEVEIKKGNSSFAHSVRASSEREALKKAKEEYPNAVIGDVYFTTRKRLEDGGYMAKGGVNQVGRQYPNYSEDMDGQKIAKPVGYRYTDRLAKRLGVDAYKRPTPAHIEKYLGRGVYMEKREDKTDNKPSKKFISLAKGGVNQVGRQYPNYSEDMDGQRIAKPVGYRYTDRLAKRLGVDAYSRPTTAHVEKYFGKGVYRELRQDKTDAKPSVKYISLAKGGVSQSGRQYPNYSEAMDGQRIAKPVGNRYTDRLAKRLGVDAYSRPTTAHVEKYMGKGVYKELREDKTDNKPSKKYISLEDGGMMARGGVERIANSNAREYSENLIPFKGNNLEGKTLDNGDYVVLSYGYYPIWYYCKADNQWYGNSTKYSVTTSKQISQSRPTYDAKMLSRADLDQLMLKHTAKFENGGVLDGILGDMGTHSVGGTMFSNGNLTPQMDITNPSF